VSSSGAASGALGGVVSAIPGRVRLRIAKPYRTSATYEQIRRTLGSTSGVSSVELNASTGSLLVLYDPETLPFGDLLTLGSALDLSAGDLLASESNGAQPAVADRATADEVLDRARAELIRSAPRAILYAAAALMGGRIASTVGVSRRLGAISGAASVLLLGKMGRSMWPGRPRA
jgi:hypothetical protein